MSHARPHLSTHARGKGHSAIAGVAYRLGLRLLDKRTGEWHDYRHRALGDEVVAAFTLAPEGAPAWATDPFLVWNAVEAAELRKDSQVGHDFRIPIPFGLTDSQAEAMARSMGQHIVADWHTVVSVGLHRDSPVDAMGLPKPPGKQGFHAHVYFPTRALAFDAEAVRDPDESGQGGSDGWAFGEKLHAFSKKKAAAVVIAELNAQWAVLANTHVAALGGVPDFTHLSYKRLGLDRVPQLRMGPQATALERKGIATRKGDALRAQLNVESAGGVLAAEAVLARAHEAELASSVQAQVSMATAIVRPAPVAAVDACASSDASRTWLHPGGPIVFRQAPAPVANPKGLAERFMAELAEKPELLQPSAAERTGLIEWLQRIEKALRSLAALALRLADLRERRQRDDTARATFLVEGDDRRRRRAQARQSVADWLKAHPWQVRLSRMVGGVDRKPTELAALEATVASFDAEVQQFKRGAADAAGRIATLDAHIARAETDHDRANETLTAAVQSVTALEPLYGLVLLSAADPDHVARVTAVLPPAPQPSGESGVAVTLRTPSAELTVPAARPRLM
ncbi:MobA/MobL family protein [Dyella sp. 333MFSha]|uniref:MobA/MobL family protein n=1 Tax=Dyella sp. 333MFSha TaxID=1798240 RepID=UPI0015A28D30|nr:MobA/MobL family protein [Dyella sp. 333MFSha]